MRSILTLSITVFVIAFVIGLGLSPWQGVVAAGSVKHGEFVYDKHCVECHGSGKKGAPVLGDKDAWADRINKSELLLADHAFYGHRKMPDLANCSTCTQQDYADAVAYMLSKVK
jgi:cytochrome c5